MARGTPRHIKRGGRGAVGCDQSGSVTSNQNQLPTLPGLGARPAGNASVPCPGAAGAPLLRVPLPTFTLSCRWTVAGLSPRATPCRSIPDMIPTSYASEQRMPYQFGDYCKFTTTAQGAHEFPLVRLVSSTMCEWFTDVITAWHPLRPRRATSSDSTSALAPPPCLVASASVHSLASHAPRVLSSSRRVRR